jgi:chromosome segregation ATPase
MTGSDSNVNAGAAPNASASQPETTEYLHAKIAEKDALIAGMDASSQRNISGLMSAVKSLGDENAALKETLYEEEVAHAGCFAQVEELESENAALKADLAMWRESFDVVNNEKRRLTNSLDKEVRSSASLTAELAKSNGNFGKLLGECAALDAQVQRVRDVANDSLRNVYAHRDENGDLVSAREVVVKALDAAPEPPKKSFARMVYDPIVEQMKESVRAFFPEEFPQKKLDAAPDEVNSE